MPSHDPTLFREQLATLMAAQNAHLAALEGLLTQEYDLLQSRDAEGLEKAGTARQQYIGHILRIEDERRALCRATGRNEDPAGLHSLLAWCDPTGCCCPRCRNTASVPGAAANTTIATASWSTADCSRKHALTGPAATRVAATAASSPRAPERPRSLPQSCLFCASQLSSEVAVVFIWANIVSSALNCLK